MMRYVNDPRFRRPERFTDRHTWLVPLLLLLATLVGPR